MTFFYFSETSEPLNEIQKSRFWDLRAGETLAKQELQAGPSGKPGTLLYYAPFGTKLKVAGFSRQHQTWIDCDGWWLGWETDNRPTPESLQRKWLISGYDRTLNDGQVWHCPTARLWQNNTWHSNVPTIRSIIGDNRELRVKADYQALWLLSGTIWDQYNSSEIDAFEQFQQCVTFLSANYRVGPEECSVLELFDDAAVVEVVKAAIDLDVVMTHKKKRASEQ